ncbi:LytR/AlgR family response regulator transcription factor [Thomasclavelia cocleata]|jgi:two-component system LytT family response regulator|uniref:LytR/AlgR family response regulator transcription factor n=1 Tax=Thomasclavelia cocleata TaxID=69824 RepID=UPI00242A985C|nr:LytTR family DNA-binding domain-containing protein [Thomasclavelia cocleata]MCI9630424.1 response regulator transcription factor [Thomasclavelia cocleata]
MIINIAICDDDLVFARKLNLFLNNELKYDTVIKIFTNGYDLLENISQFDIIFLDYEMPILDGLSILDQVKNHHIKIIMASNYEHIAFKTYKYELYWFIRKKHFSKDMPDLIDNLHVSSAQDKKKFRFTSYSNSISIYINNINYVTTEKNYVYIHTDFDVYKLRASFGSILDQFKDDYFMMPTYGVLVNMKYIKYIDFTKSSIVLNDDTILTISRSNKIEVKNKYVKYNSR